jgi:hypothetical protein
MTTSESARWLDARGGSWYVRASSALCVVVAVLGPTRVVVRADELSADAVEEALDSAVDRIRLSDGAKER